MEKNPKYNEGGGGDKNNIEKKLALFLETYMTDQEIADVYYTPGAAGSFQGPVKLYQYLRKKGVNITLADVTKWLNRQDVYTINRMARHRFDKGTIIAKSLNEQWHADLAYFGQWASDNNDVQYLIIIIYVFF